MNILFYSKFGADVNSGGVQHVTHQIAQELKNTYGHRCFLSSSMSCTISNDCIFDETIYIDKQTDGDEIKSFISINKVDCIVVQGNYYMLDVFRQTINKLNLNIDLLFCLHGEPRFEYKIKTIENQINCIKYSNGLLRYKYLYHLLLFYYDKYLMKKFVATRYKNVFQNADRVVLLSDRHIEGFCKFAGVNNSNNKVCVINNPTSYDVNVSEIEILKKKHRVLIVARFEEYSKKISLALRSWSLLERKYDIGDWALDIVGDGEAAPMYHKIADEHHLHKVNFYGFQTPESFYEKSSIFLMTSWSEGWPLSLAESMQYGCVPVAFDSFPSVKDLIDNGENGFLVKYHDLSMLSEKIYFLMQNAEVRESMAEKAMLSMKKFSMQNVGKKWNDLLKSSINKINFNTI